MTITHTKVSAKSDGTDATLVQPSDWNASHTIANSTITYAMIQNVAANRILGNNTGGAAAPAELTASQILDLVSNTNGVLLTRTGGTWAALANVTTDNGDIVIANNAAPAAPAAGMKLSSQSIGGRSMPGWIGTAGSLIQAQPLIGRRSVMQVIPINNSASFTTIGISAGTASGTATVRALATTNAFTSSKRVGFVSAATGGSVAGWRFGQSAQWRGNAAGLGGFHIIWRFGWSDAALVGTGQGFAGLWTVGAPTDVAPSTLTNIIGIGNDNGDTTMQLYASGSAAQAKTSLGVNFPANTVSTDIYELVLFAAPNASSVTYQVTRLNTGDTTSGTISNSLNLPSNTTFLAPNIWRSNGGTASAVGVDLLSFYGESDM